MPYSSASLESTAEREQDICFGLVFLFISCFAAVRVKIYYDLFGRGKIITIFYMLIFLTAVTRTVWFLVPSDYLEGPYTPEPVMAYSADSGRSHWRGILLSELLLSTGSISLYSVFILIASYWSHMLTKIDYSVAERDALGNVRQTQRRKKGPSALRKWASYMAVIVAVQALNVLLYTSRRFNSLEMILFDSIYLSAVSVIILLVMTLLSQRIQALLLVIGAINNTSTRPQVRRIYAITFAINAFFIVRVAIELTFAISLVMLMRSKNSISVIIDDDYWLLYVTVKHSTEVLVLVLELVISTAIKSYDNTRSGGVAKVGDGSSNDDITRLKNTEYTPINPVRYEGAGF